MDTGEDYAPDFEDAATIPAGVSHGHGGMGHPTHHASHVTHGMGMGGMAMGMGMNGNGDAKRPPRLNFAAFGHSSDTSAPMMYHIISIITCLPLYHYHTVNLLNHDVIICDCVIVHLIQVKLVVAMVI